MQTIGNIRQFCSVSSESYIFGSVVRRIAFQRGVHHSLSALLKARLLPRTSHQHREEQAAAAAAEHLVVTRFLSATNTNDQCADIDFHSVGVR